MKFIFYQNILSIHQSAFIRNLAKEHSVSLVVSEDVNLERKSQGWSTPDFGETHVFVDPSLKKLKELLRNTEAIHIFSGINSFPLPSKAFKIAVKNKLKIGVILEPFNWLGLKGKLRFLKYAIYKFKYGNQIDFILAIGNKGRWCYEKVGFSKCGIYDWAYFTEEPKINQLKDRSNILKLLFIGSINRRKNILSLVDACLAIADKSFHLTIIGTGVLESLLKEKIKQSDKINHLGTVPNKHIAQYIHDADVLILPSIFDGWGAVVNEALMCGVPVIASDHCGASVLLDNMQRGSVFSVKKNDLKDIICNFINRLPYSLEQRNEIKQWAQSNISGEAAANYFIEIIRSVYFNGKKSMASWINK